MSDGIERVARAIGSLHLQAGESLDDVGTFWADAPRQDALGRGYREGKRWEIWVPEARAALAALHCAKEDCENAPPVA